MDKYIRFLGYGGLLVSAFVVAIHAVHDLGMAPDSMRYALVADQMLSGRGLRVPIIWFQRSPITPDSFGTVPFLCQPPLLPAFLAMLGGVTPDGLLAAQFLNIASHLIVVVFSFLIARKICGSLPGAVVGMSVAFSFCLVHSLNFLCSDPLFIAFVAVAVWSLVASRESSRKWEFAFLSGLMAAAAIGTRFCGVALLPMFIWEFVLEWKNKTIWSAIRLLSLSLSVPLIAITILAARNVLLSGSIRGFYQTDPGRSVFDAFYGFVFMTARQFGVNNIGLKMVSGILFLAIPIAAMFYFRSRKSIYRAFGTGLDLVMLFVFSYTGLLTYAMANYQPVFESRFAAPLIPFCLILLVVALDLGWRSMQGGHLGTLAKYGRIMAITLVLVYTVREYSLHPKDNSLPVWRNFNQAFLSSDTYKWITEHCSSGSVIATNGAFNVAFFAKCPTLRLPSRSWNKLIDLPNDMDSRLPQRMSEVGARYLVIFSGPQ